MELDVLADPTCPLGETWDATATAVMMVLDRASRAHRQGIVRSLWAVGKIVLRDPEGEIVHTMEAK